MAILVSGSLAYDYIMNFPDSFKNHILPDQIHILNVCFVVDKLGKGWGGTGGNIVYSMKLLGADPIIAAAIGKDGKDYLEHLKNNGLDTKYIKIEKEKMSASAYITTDVDDNQVTAFYNGPLALAAEIKIKDIKEKITLALISPNQKEVMMKHLRECKELGIPAVFDPGQQITAFNDTELKQMISQADFVVGNDYEIKLLEERTGWDAKKILSETKVVITTLGERGSVISTRDGEVVEVSPCPPKSVDDPTGAGDAYRAGFFVAYDKGLSLKVCGQVGSVAASYAIETYGTQEHKFTKEEFCDKYFKNYGEKVSL